MSNIRGKFGRRQIILAALILALGATVYLNWQFSSVPMETAGTEVGEAGEKDFDDERLGVAELVNNQYVETVNDEMPAAEETASMLSEARMDRQNTRDEALGMLDDILKDVDSDSDAKKEAIEEASVIANNMLAESNIENLIRAKGVKDVVVFINEDSCNIVVNEIGDNALLIQDIVTSQSDITADKISLIEAK